MGNKRLDLKCFTLDNIAQGEKKESTMGGTSMIFNILIKKEEDVFIAHCLELDIVTTSKYEKEVINDILDLVKAQVNYAFSNDNLVHLFHPAPPEVWVI